MTVEALHIVLVEPEIPPNTGNIARLCAATGSRLHLVGKLGFSTDDRYLRRAGLDYWEHVELRYWGDLDELKEQYPDGRFFYLSTRVARSFLDIAYLPGDFLVFGKETAGLPQAILDQYADSCVRLPMIEGARSLNLSNAVAVSVYEALRQTGYGGLR